MKSIVLFTLLLVDVILLFFSAFLPNSVASSSPTPNGSSVTHLATQEVRNQIEGNKHFSVDSVTVDPEMIGTVQIITVKGKIQVKHKDGREEEMPVVYSVSHFTKNGEMLVTQIDEVGAKKIAHNVIASSMIYIQEGTTLEDGKVSYNAIVGDKKCTIVMSLLTRTVPSRWVADSLSCDK